MLKIVENGKIPTLASGVLSSGWANGMTVPLGVTVDRGKVGLLFVGSHLDSAYQVCANAYLGADDAFTLYFPLSLPAHNQRWAWKVLDLSRVLRPGERVQRGRTSFNKSGISGYWQTKTTTLDLPLGKYQAAHCNTLNIGAGPIGGGYYISQMYPTISGPQTVQFEMYEFTGGDTSSYYVSWEVWPLKD